MKFWIIIIAIFAGFVGFVMFGSSKAPSTMIKKVPQNAFESLVGKAAPEFTLKSYDGSTVSLSSLRGKKVVIFFNEGIVCYPACWNQIAALGPDKDLNNDKIATLSIVPDAKEQWSTATRRMPALGKETLLLDTDLSVSRQYGVLNLESSMHKGVKPGHTYVVVDKDGIVRYTYDDPTMGIQNNRLKQELTKL